MNNFLLASQTGGISFIVIMALLTVVVFVAAVWLICIGLRNDSIKLKLKPKYIFLIVLGVGAAVRMGISFAMRGLVGDITAAQTAARTGYTGLFNMVNDLISDGFNGFWAKYEQIMYYPLTMYILAFFSSVGSLFWPMSITSEATLIFIKLPFIISDILLAFVVFKIAEKYTGDLVALAIGSFVALCPIFMMGSIWPSVYSFYALALAVTLYFMLERKYVLLIVSYTLCLLICFEAVYLLPIIAVFIIYAYIKKLNAYKNASVKASLWGSEYGMLIKVPVAIVACMLGSYLVALPFALSMSKVGANPFAILYILYLKPFDKFGYFTYNGLSLYTIFNKNGVRLALSFPTFVFSLLFAVAIIAVTLIIYLTKKNRANLVLFASYVLLTVNTYFVNSTELTLLPFFAVTLIAFALLKDRRLLQILGLMSIMTFLNAAGVLLSADYFTANALQAVEVLSETWMVLSIFSSVVAVLCHIYYTFIMLDVTMNGKTKKISALGNGLGSSLKALIRTKD